LNKGNAWRDVFADSAYRSAEIEATLKARGFKSRIHVRAARSHPLSKTEEEANRKKSRVRVRVEHVFGAQQTSPGGRIVRTIGIVRARAKIGLQNLVYNIRRIVTSNGWPSHEVESVLGASERDARRTPQSCVTVRSPLKSIEHFHNLRNRQDSR
jgi:hypothetical protein